jgi:hypothetical protein
MIRRICLSAALVMLAAPAFAAAPDDACMEPTLPKMPNGRTSQAADDVAAAKTKACRARTPIRSA